MFLYHQMWKIQQSRLVHFVDDRTSFFLFLFLILLASRVSLGAVRLNSSSGSFRVSCCHGLGISLVEDGLNNLLFFRTQNLREILIELWLFLLKAW